MFYAFALKACSLQLLPLQYYLFITINLDYSLIIIYIKPYNQDYIICHLLTLSLSLAYTYNYA